MATSMKLTKSKTSSRTTTMVVPRATKPIANVQTTPTVSGRFIKWFGDIRIEDVPLVGGKNASLGEMYRELTSKGVKVPDGFAITAEAYRHLLREAGLEEQIRKALAGLDTRDVE